MAGETIHQLRNANQMDFASRMRIRGEEAKCAMASSTSTRSRRGNAEADTPPSAAETGTGSAAEQQRLHEDGTLIISIMALTVMGIFASVNVGMQERTHLHRLPMLVQDRRSSNSCMRIKLLTSPWNLRQSRREDKGVDLPSTATKTGAGASEQRKLPQEMGIKMESAADEDAAAAADWNFAADRDEAVADGHGPSAEQGGSSKTSSAADAEATLLSQSTRERQKTIMDVAPGRLG